MKLKRARRPSALSFSAGEASFDSKTFLKRASALAYCRRSSSFFPSSRAISRFFGSASAFFLRAP
tara:strand:- start:484 stop:678 length:195 start_codon:yes stop_codon:yes gene_type:complete